MKNAWVSVYLKSKNFRTMQLFLFEKNLTFFFKDIWSNPKTFVPKDDMKQIYIEIDTDYNTSTLVYGRC